VHGQLQAYDYRLRTFEHEAVVGREIRLALGPVQQNRVNRAGRVALELDERREGGPALPHQAAGPDLLADLVRIEAGRLDAVPVAIEDARQEVVRQGRPLGRQVEPNGRHAASVRQDGDRAGTDDAVDRRMNRGRDERVGVRDLLAVLDLGARLVDGFAGGAEALGHGDDEVLGGDEEFDRAVLGVSLAVRRMHAALKALEALLQYVDSLAQGGDHCSPPPERVFLKPK
jgi:hypothetical protein